MKPTIEQIKAASKALDEANVPTSGRFYRYINKDGEMIDVKVNNSPTIGSLFPCLGGKHERS